MAQRVFKLALFGLSDQERMVIKSVINFALTHDRVYEILEVNDDDCPDIVLLDADDPKAYDLWRFRCNKWKSHSNPDEFVTIILSQNDLSHKTQKPFIQRPLFANNVWKLIHKTTIASFRYVPELMVGENVELDALTEDVLRDIAAAETSADANVLVVDDSATVRKYMKMQLGLFGITAHFAETGQQAMSFIDNKHYDVVFLDLGLPDMNGVDICKTIKADKQTSDTQVIIMSAKNKAFSKVKAAMAGCDEYLMKPVKQNKLQAVIKEFFPETREHLKLNVN